MVCYRRLFEDLLEREVIERETVPAGPEKPGGR
jgi:hypothetical protein